MTQFQVFSTTSLDELVISPAQMSDFMSNALDCPHPFGALYTSTVRILHYAFWLAKQKATLARKEYKELLKKLGWEGEEKRYLKLEAAFNIFLPHELALVEIHTLFQIAGNLKKYSSVISQMKTLATITQDKVRGFLKQCRKPRATREETESGEATIWQLIDGKRACQIGPIYDQPTGVMLEFMMNAEGRTAQAIIGDAVSARYESKYQFLIEVSPVPSGVVEVTEYLAPDNNVETVSVNSYESWDADSLTAEPDSTESETSEYSQECDEDEDTQDAWSFEPDEKDDLIEDYEFLTFSQVEFKIEVPLQEETQKQGQAVENVFSTSPTAELAAVDLLIQTLQTANSWEEISKVLKAHEQYKQTAWDALTQAERKRVLEMTPPTIKRLNHAKREGLIADFREVSLGLYEIRYNGCCLWETVFEYRVEEFFAQLVTQSCAQV
ncbi:hypothetical protein NIES4071_106850 (plasmid) [Calothrix sp. NIES-4071]|nr:hypothetical protein NIES4071_106850 [Calothrix sp. NIES-4071]BAZ64725.1 hypothetical protein NIES4105_104580 [Calothrix sp. NIES-4105]